MGMIIAPRHYLCALRIFGAINPKKKDLVGFNQSCAECSSGLLIAWTKGQCTQLNKAVIYFLK
jgi:hypothetical protein